MIHQSVMLQEAMEALQVEPGKFYLDATFGGGGHSREIIRRGGHVIALDQDEGVLPFRVDLPQSPQFQLVIANFDQLAELAKTHSWPKFSGILFDLGTSSMQLQDPHRGFSYVGDAPLDMRLSADLTVTAAHLVNALSQKELTLIFTKYAQERRAGSIAKAIVRARQIRPFQTTGQLVALIDTVYPQRVSKIHPATKVFQALRITVNDELGSLSRALEQVPPLLNPGGRLVIISFHQGEDKIVKNFYQAKAQAQIFQLITPKPLVPSAHEISQNHRSRSAKLRIAQQLI